MTKLARVWVLAIAWSLLLVDGCSNMGFDRVSDDVYVSKSTPELHRAAQEISSARKEARSIDPQKAPDRLLSVAVNEQAGLGPEAFSIAVDEKTIRVEGGDAGGALYGALEMARTIREGRDPVSIDAVRPLFQLRALKMGAGLPGVSEEAATVAVDWRRFLDDLAAARMNTLEVSCGHVFPYLLTLRRYPKAFEGMPNQARENASRSGAFREFLDRARERNVQVILTVRDLRIPASFLRRYAESQRDSAINSPLSRSYLKECFAELLRNYTPLAGVGIDEASLSGIPTEDVLDFVRAVLGGGIRASGRRGILLIAAEVAASLGDLDLPSEVDLVVERSWTPGPRTDERPAGRARPDKSCFRIPLDVLSPSLPSAESARSILDAIRVARPCGFVMELSRSREASGYLFERDLFFSRTYGLSAFEPPLDKDSWRFLWRDFLGSEAEAPQAAAASLASIWEELAKLHSPDAGWSPLTAVETRQAPADFRGLRDSSPFVSILEFMFSPSADPAYLTIPEFVASQVRGIPPTAGRRLPPEVGERLIKQSEMSLGILSSLLATREPGKGLSPNVAAAVGELTATAHMAKFHGHRIQAAVALLRYIAGLEDTGKQTALEEVRRGIESWSVAAGTFTSLRADLGGSAPFPDLEPLRDAVLGDARRVEDVRPDPSAFRQSPLVMNWPFKEPFDFRSLRGFLKIGGLLDDFTIDCAEAGQLFEAEDFAGNWSVASEVQGYSGEGYLSSGMDGTRAGLPVTIRLLIQKPGPRQIWVRALSGVAAGSAAIRLKVGQVDLEPTHAEASGYVQFTWQKAGEVNLATTDSFLQILDGGPGREGVDCLVITSDSEWSPPTF